MPRGRKTAAAALRWSAGNEGRGARRAGAAPVGKSGPVRRQVGGAGAGRGGGCPRRSAQPSPRAHARTAKQGPCGAQPVAYIRLEVCHTALARIELNLGADHVPPTRPLPVRGHCRHDRLHLRRLGEAYGIMAVQRLRELLAPLLLVVCRCCPSGCVCHPALASRSDLVGAYVRAPARGGLWRGRECRRLAGGANRDTRRQFNHSFPTPRLCPRSHASTLQSETCLGTQAFRVAACCRGISTPWAWNAGRGADRPVSLGGGGRDRAQRVRYSGLGKDAGSAVTKLLARQRNPTAWRPPPRASALVVGSPSRGCRKRVAGACSRPGPPVAPPHPSPAAIAMAASKDDAKAADGRLAWLEARVRETYKHVKVRDMLVVRRAWVPGRRRVPARPGALRGGDGWPFLRRRTSPLACP